MPAVWKRKIEGVNIINCRLAIRQYITACLADQLAVRSETYIMSERKELLYGKAWREYI